MSNKPITLVINTQAHADHFGANEAMAKGGALIVAHANLRERMAKGQTIAAFNQTLPPSPPAVLPTITYPLPPRSPWATSSSAAAPTRSRPWS